MKDDDKLKLVSGRTRPIEWESFPRREPRPARERLRGLAPSAGAAERCKAN